MFADRQFRPIAHHDTWMSIDPIRGCPFNCTYCVLRHAGTTAMNPQVVLSPRECVDSLLEHRLFVRALTPLAIGNETDVFHPKNVDYLLSLLGAMRDRGITNPIVLITKARLSDEMLDKVRAIEGLRIVFFLSYSGLGPRFEPNFTCEQLRGNFGLVRQHGFPLVHYWRPLLPENTTNEAIREMLGFASKSADASVFVGLKLHPELTRIITQEGIVRVPHSRYEERGEWLAEEMVKSIYDQASNICPEYPLYRHASCALAYVLRAPNQTGTIYRKDVCPPSHCPAAQRKICEASRRIPTDGEIGDAVSRLTGSPNFERLSDRVKIDGEVTQEEFCFLLHKLNCPVEVKAVKMQNLYYGDIYVGQKQVAV